MLSILLINLDGPGFTEDEKSLWSEWNTTDRSDVAAMTDVLRRARSKLHPNHALMTRIR